MPYGKERKSEITQVPYKSTKAQRLWINFVKNLHIAASQNLWQSRGIPPIANKKYFFSHFSGAYLVSLIVTIQTQAENTHAALEVNLYAFSGGIIKDPLQNRDIGVNKKTGNRCFNYDSAYRSQ